jgi:hypothetical protein
METAWPPLSVAVTVCVMEVVITAVVELVVVVEDEESSITETVFAATATEP